MTTMDLKQSIQAQLAAVMFSATAVYQELLPATAVLPAVTWQKISQVPAHSHDGYSGISNVRLQVDLWAGNEEGREALLADLRAGLDGFRGHLGGDGGVYCGRSFLANVIDQRDADTGWFRAIVDFILATNN